MSTRRRQRAGRLAERRQTSTRDDDDDDDEPEAENPPAPSAASDSEDESVEATATPQQQSHRRRVLRRERTTAALRGAREQMPDHVPPLKDRLAAFLRAYFCGQSDAYFLSRYAVASSTPLQMLLYFNVLFSLVWAVMNQVLFQWKAGPWDPPLLAAVVSPMLFWVWFILEPIRLVLGFVGNLGERVAWLAGFWVLTLFPQLVVHIYFVAGQNAIGWFTMPIEYAMSGMMMALYVVQLITGYGANKRLVAKAKADFNLARINAPDELDRRL